MGLLCANVSNGQLKKQFFVEDSDEFESVNVSLKVDFGACHIKSTKNPGIFNLYSFQDSDHYSHSFKKEISDGVCNLDLSLEEEHTEGLGKSISNSIFSRTPSDRDNFWKVFLSENKAYNLRLDYGVGVANIDLSGLAVENLRIHTGSADINVGYLTDGVNQIEMDTFYVKVDMGNVKVKNLGHAKSKYVVADVGFGNLFLDLSDVQNEAQTIKGNVGAGTLFISMPKSNNPMKLVVTESWLCRVKIPSGFEKISENTYVNERYYEDAENVLTFDVDVSLGSLIFHQD
jgi:hypothetical protein